MSRRNKKRVRAVQPTPHQQQGHGQAAPAWPTVPPPPMPGGERPHVSAVNDHGAQPDPAGGDAECRPKSGYDNSRGNACKHGRRSRVVFPDQLADLIEQKTSAFLEAMKPRNEWETFLISELARATVLVEDCGNQVIADEVRLYDRLSDDDLWAIDAERRVDRVAVRIHRHPEMTVRELERTKQGTEYLLSNFRGLGDVVASNNALDEAQLALLYSLLGVPHQLRDGSRRVPPASDGPALAALIAKEVTRLERRLEHVLTGQDRCDQNFAKTTRATCRDETHRRLRSDESRNLKRLYWAEAALAKLRSGAPPETIIDPETKAPIHPRAHDAPTAQPKTAPAAAPPAPTPPAPPPVEDPAPRPPRVWPAFMDRFPPEDRECFKILPGFDEIAAAAHRAQHKAVDGLLAPFGPDVEPGPPPAL